MVRGERSLGAIFLRFDLIVAVPFKFVIDDLREPTAVLWTVVLLPFSPNVLYEL